MALDEQQTKIQLINPALEERGWPLGLVAPEVKTGRVTSEGEWSSGTADYVLYVEIAGEREVAAVLEAKAVHRDPKVGASQAREYARSIKAPFAFATNGHVFVEVDSEGSAGLQKPFGRFPTPNELKQRHPAQQDMERQRQKEREGKERHERQLREMMRRERAESERREQEARQRRERPRNKRTNGSESDRLKRWQAERLARNRGLGKSAEEILEVWQAKRHLDRLDAQSPREERDRNVWDERDQSDSSQHVCWSSDTKATREQDGALPQQRVRRFLRRIIGR